MRMKSRLTAIAVVCVGISTTLGARASGKDLIGEWQVLESVSGMQRQIRAISTFGQDGSFLTAGDQQGPPVPGAAGPTRIGPGFGTWKRTGAREFQLTFYAVLCNKQGIVKGYQKVRGTIELRESGDELEASGESQFSDTNGKVFATVPVEVKGMRLESPSRLTAIR
jgi:hypothetical protein